MVNICEITIGKFVFHNVNHVHIESSRRKLGDECVITLPRRYESKSLAKEIKEGDQVIVKLGYQESGLVTEFIGYVNIIGCNTPVEISCEDEVYNLKRTMAKPHSWSSISLKDLLKYMMPSINAEVPDMTLSPFYIKGELNVAAALEKIRDDYGLDIYFRDGNLFAGMAYSEKAMTVIDPIIYYLKWTGKTNVIKNDLEFRRADSFRIKLKAVSMLPNNKVIKYECGDLDGEIRTIHHYNKTLAELKILADEDLKNFKYDGYKGKFQTFGNPISRQGMIADLTEEGFEEKNGRYFIDKVTVDFGLNGYRRENELGRMAS